MGRALSFALAAAVAASLGCATGSDGDKSNARMLDEMRRMQAEQRSAEQKEESAPPQSIDALLREGDGLRRSGDLPRALWAYLRAHSVDRADPRPLTRIGKLHLAVDPERSEQIFREIVASSSGSAPARTGLGLALIARGQWDPAVAELRQAIAQDDGLGIAHDALGVALERQGDVAAARESYRRAAALQPLSHEPLNNLGVSYLRTGEFEAAVEALRRAAELEPRDPAVQNNLGLALGRLERYDDALDAFRKAGNEQAALNNLGYVHYLNRDYAGALEIYERALLVPGGDPEQRLSVLRNLRAARRAQDGSPPVAAPGPAPAPAEGGGATEAAPSLPAAPAPP